MMIAQIAAAGRNRPAAEPQQEVRFDDESWKQQGETREDPDKILWRAVQQMDEIDSLLKQHAKAETFIPILESITDASLTKALHIDVARISGELIKEVARVHSTNSTVVLRVLQQLCNLSYTLPALGILVGQGYVNVVLHCMRDYFNNSAMQVAGMKFLVNVTCHMGFRSGLSEDEDMFPIILKSMEANRKHATLQKEGMRTIINLNFEKSMRRIIVQSEVIGTVREAMVHGRAASLHLEALRCLYNLSYQNKTIKEQILKEDMILTVSSSMREFLMEDNLLLYGFQLLCNLAIAGEVYRQEIRKSGVMSIAAQAKKVPNAKLYVKVTECQNILAGNLRSTKGVGDIGRTLEDSGADDEQFKDIPIEFVIKSLSERNKASSRLGGLLLYIPFLIMFIFFFQGNQPSGEESYYAVKAMSEQIVGTEMFGPKIYKGFLDINNVDDWWMWFKPVMIETVLWRPDQESGGFGRFPVGNMMVLGAFRVRTFTIRTDSCEANPYLFPNGGVECLDRMADGKQNTTAYMGNMKYMTCEETGEGLLTADTVFPCSGHVYDFPFNMSLDDVRVQAELIHQQIGNSLTRLSLHQFFVYLPPFDCFASFKVINDIKAGGRWINRYQFRLFRIWSPIGSMGQTIFDICFYLFVILYVIQFFKGARQEMKIYQTSPLRYFLSFWNLLEAFNLICFILVLVLKIQWILKSWEVTKQGPSMLLETKVYPSHFEPILLYFSWTVYVNAINCFLTFFKLLKFLAMNNNFNILTRTCEKAATPCVGMFVCWFIIMIAYCLMGCMVYGTSLEDFRGFDASFGTLMRFLVGDFDWDSLREENRFLAYFFFWSFVILQVFMVLNFLIAIFTDAFSEVNAETINASFDMQLDNMIKETTTALSGPAVIRRLQLLYYKTSVNQVVEEMLEDDILPYRSRLRAKHYWKILRHYVRVTRAKNKSGIQDVALNAASTIIETTDGPTVTKKELQQLVPWAKIALIGQPYFDSLWQEIVFKYSLLQDHPAEQESAEEQAQVISVARQVVNHLQGQTSEAISVWVATVKQFKIVRQYVGGRHSKAVHDKRAT
uniref:Polycystin cation channel PKD1/PKD2 domain-containing protein n=1 Tax=Eutreptiella gymnastica TaxID=73025 RepID=A0A7S1NLL2_9EUGL|mmetsp:Transcript_55408/g.98671  ORF Transcript_55408/g.98671 Transcript_55408/m.98671 type:complete len:1063 (+) Transcript_55408:74-3262(+)